jgi:hypothetical protein
MADDIDDIDETLDDDAVDDLDDAEPTTADLEDTAQPPETAAAGPVESIQEILQKQEEKEEAAEEDTVLATITRDDRLEPIDTRVVPIQATEFTCKRCFLVKHRSQLADKKRTLCRDCA